MRARAATELLALPVTHRDIELGRPVDVLLDVAARRWRGLDVRCADGVHRFLPLGAARIEADAISVGSPLTLLDDLAFYRARGASFRSLRGAPVARAGRHAGSLEDVLLDDRGALRALRLRAPAGALDVLLAGDVEVGGERSASAA
jgi:hypothetical protein